METYVYDADFNPVESPDAEKGSVEYREAAVTHRWVQDVEEEGHFETVAEYENGGKDVEWVVDKEGSGHWETYREGGELFEGYPGVLAEDWPHDTDVSDVFGYFLYTPYTDEELAEIERQREEAERVAQEQQTISQASTSFFLDGGKERMERSIEEAAASGGSDPQLRALASLQVMAMDLTGYTSTQVAGFRDYWPEWQPDTKYEYQQPLRWKGLYYRASKALTSSATYPPDTAGESEYYPIEVAGDGVIVYRACHGQYDMVQAGETRHYPDADGPVYRAKVDTAYDPDTVPDNWKMAQG